MSFVWEWFYSERVYGLGVGTYLLDVGVFFRCLVQPGMIVEEEMMVEGREPRCALHYPLLLLPHVYLKRKYNAIKHYGLDEWAIKR